MEKQPNRKKNAFMRICDLQKSMSQLTTDSYSSVIFNVSDNFWLWIIQYIIKINYKPIIELFWGKHRDEFSEISEKKGSKS